MGSDPDEITHLMDPHKELLLWPLPNTIETGNDIRDLGDGCFFEIDVSSIAYYTTEINRVVEIYYKNIFKNIQCTNNIPKTLQVIVDNPQQICIDNLTQNEEYTLEINQTSIILKTETYVGILRGLETFSQLIYYNVTYCKYQKRQYNYYIPQTPLKIHDKPKFSYRGLLIDTSRHYLSLSTIKRTIDGLMYSKMNRLHWHITDDESYPLQSYIYLDLYKKGAYSQTQIYTLQNVKDIVRYGLVRGVQVIPEIDQPAHVLSWGNSQQIRPVVVGWNNQTQLLPAGFLDPTLQLTYDVIQNLIREIHYNFKSQYIHLGGDEVVFDVWAARKTIKAFMKKNNISNYEQLQITYHNKVRDILKNINQDIQPIYWSNHHNLFMKYSKNDILQWWGVHANLTQVLKQYPLQQFIISSYDYLYLDCGQGSLLGINSWCDPYSTWKKIYSIDIPEQPNILGGTVCMWSELVNDENIDSKVWPRAAALSEVLWKFNKEKNVPSVARRLGAHGLRLLQRGIQASPITSQSCLRDIQACLKTIKF